VNQLVSTANHCRDRRQELSLLILEPNIAGDASATLPPAGHQVRRAIEDACSALDEENVSLLSLSNVRTVAIIANCERRAAISVAQSAIRKLRKPWSAPEDSGDEQGATLSVGVATASVVAKNFDPGRMIECAVRCLSAARACGISAVKSIEV
jgi:hypothetical protein